MSQQIDKNNNPDARRKILQYTNDVMHEELAKNNIVVVAIHNRADPRKFTIVADSEYDRQLENVELTFVNPEDYKRIFPEFSSPPPVYLTPGMERDRRTGAAVPIHKDPYTIRAVYSYPQPENPTINDVNHVLNNDDSLYWSVNHSPATLIMDLGRDCDIGCLWVKWFAGNERQSKFTVAVSTEEQFTTQDKTFTVLDHLDGKYSSGKTNDFEAYNLVEDPDMLVKGRFIMLKVYGNTNDSARATIRQVRVTKAVAIKSCETDNINPSKSSDKIDRDK